MRPADSGVISERATTTDDCVEKLSRLNDIHSLTRIVGKCIAERARLSEPTMQPGRQGRQHIVLPAGAHAACDTLQRCSRSIVLGASGFLCPVRDQFQLRRYLGLGLAGCNGSIEPSASACA